MKMAEFLDFKLKMNENSKIIIAVFSKPTNSFTYVIPSTSYPSIISTVYLQGLF